MTEINWLDQHGRSPHDRLNIFAKLWGESQEWASGIDAKLVELVEKLLPDVHEADDITTSLVDAQGLQKTTSDDLRKLQEEIAFIRGNIADAKDSLDEIAAGLALALTEGTVPERKQRLLVAQGNSDQYQKQLNFLRDAEKEKLVKQAHCDYAEREYKRLGEQIKNLRARLQHWTARAQMVKGE